MQVLAVVYDKGAASPGEVLRALRDVTQVAFIVPASDHVREVLPVLRSLGPVLPLTGDVERDADRIQRLRPAGIVTYCEAMLGVTSALADALGLTFHSPAATRSLTDKIRQRRRLADAGVDAVRHCAVTGPAGWPEAVRRIGVPAVLKPVTGGGSRSTFLVGDQAAADRLRSEARPGMVLEELLRGRDNGPFGDYVSVESVTGPEGTTHVAVLGKYPLIPPFRELGHIWPAPLDPDEDAAVRALADGALAALGVRGGITQTEIKLTPEGPRIIEVNGRLGGHVHEIALRAGGVDLVRAAGLLALGRPAPVVPRPAGRVYFQYNGAGPTEPCTLTAVHGAKAVRAAAGITAYRGYVRPGERLPGGTMTYPLDLLCGDAADHGELFPVLNGALAHLAYEFAFDDGAVTVQAPPVPWH